MAVVGSSHNGLLSLARRHIEVAAESGWSSVSFQPKLPDLMNDARGLDQEAYAAHCELHGLDPKDRNAYWDYLTKAHRMFNPAWHQELAAFAHEKGLAYTLRCTARPRWSTWRG